MSIENDLKSRCDSKCELCASTDNLDVYSVPPKIIDDTSGCILICSSCLDQIEHPEKTKSNYWRCLSDSMWSQIPAVQVVVWRILTRLNDEAWAQNLLDMLYLDEKTLKWAQDIGEIEQGNAAKHCDAFGAELVSGDTVTLIKDLPVKGANFVAKRGTSVRGISLVAENIEYIEGRVNAQKIVILTQFVKKSK